MKWVIHTLTRLEVFFHTVSKLSGTVVSFDCVKNICARHTKTNAVSATCSIVLWNISTLINFLRCKLTGKMNQH